MPILARMMFGMVSLAARRGLSEVASAAGTDSTSDASPAAATKAGKDAARRTGVRGETYAYWYLRRRGYVIVSRNFTVPGMKGEIDLAGYDGKVLAFVEVKTRSMDSEKGDGLSLPEDAITPNKKRALARMARMFMTEWRIPNAPCRFDVLAIESRAGQRPVVRLHKDCFGISGR
jgi:putative endonuclease